MFDKRLKLGTILGIGLYVHWTFALLLGFAAYQARDHGITGMSFSIALALGVFTCVTLHEYGHAMAARRFGIPTVDITLLPIGGVARLERMPRIPWQELVVAVAGPAVNVVIGSLLVIGSFLVPHEPFLELYGSFVEFGPWATPSISAFVLMMLIANIGLVAFNMVPAFPMDGGRVFRSLIAMVTSYGKATLIASRVGLVCAAMMGMLGLAQNAPILFLIAMFIAYAGVSEARQVDVTESVRGLSIRDSMIHHPPSISMDTTLPEIAMMWRNIAVPELPVISFNGTVVGVIRIGDVAKAVKNGVDPRSTAGQLADHGVMTAEIDDDIEHVVLGAGRGNRFVPVVDAENQLIGILDLQSLSDRGRVAGIASTPGAEVSSQLDVVN